MKINVVDENELVAKTLREFLGDLGHSVRTFSNAKELLASLEKNRSPGEIIITDLSLHRKDTVSLIREIYNLFPDVRIVAMSASISTLPPDLAVSCGIYAFLRKPVSLSELELMIIRLSERKMKNAQNKVGLGTGRKR